MEEASTPASTASAPNVVGDGNGINSNNNNTSTNTKTTDTKTDNNSNTTTTTSTAENSNNSNKVSTSNNETNNSNNESNAANNIDDGSTSSIRVDLDAGKGANNGNGDAVATAPAAAAAAAAADVATAESAAAVTAVAAVPAVASDPGHPLDEGGCFVCKKNDQQDLILLCDGCDGEYHTFCFKPPVRVIPENEWFCHHCRAAGKGGPKPEPKSRYTGVYWAGTGKGTVWTAKIRRRAGRGEATIGSYSSEKEAAGAYDAEAKRVFGDAHPPLNFPDGNWDDEPDEPEEPEEAEAVKPKQREGPKQPEGKTSDAPKQREEPDAPGPARELEESKQEDKAREPTQQEPADPKQPEQPDGPAQREKLDAPTQPEEPGGPGQREGPDGPSQHEEPKESNEPLDLRQFAETPMTEHVTGGGDVGDAGWVNISDVGGHGTSTSGRPEKCFAGAGVGSSAGLTAYGTSSGGASSMYAGGIVDGVGGRGSSSHKSGAANVLSGPGMGTAQSLSSGASNGITSERSTSAGTSGVSGTLSAITSSARPGMDGLDSNGGGGARFRGPVNARQARPQLSVDIPADQNTGAEIPKKRSHKRKPRVGDGDRSLPTTPTETPTETPTGRRRVKAKWLQEYEYGDDMEMHVTGKTPKATPKAKRDKRRGSNESHDASADTVAGDVGTAPQAHHERKKSVESDDPTGGSPRSADVASNDKQKAKGKASAKKKTPWGGKDWAGHALSKSSLLQIKDTVRMWAMSDDGTLVGEDGNHFFCSVCGEHGELTCCDFCPRVFHEECLTLGSDSQLAAEHQTAKDPWYCPSCVEAGKVNLVQGVVPKWTTEQRKQTPKPVPAKKADKASNKTSANSSSSKASKGGHRPPTSPSSPTPRPEVTVAKTNATKRAATVHAGAAASASVAVTEAPPAPAAVNVNDAADPPLLVSRVNVFAPELDNNLLRSLLYDKKYTHVLPKAVPAKKQRAPRTKAGQSKAGVHERAAEERVATTATLEEEQAALVDTRTGMPVVDSEPSLGALTTHLPLSSQAGKRPRYIEHSQGTRLGPPFGGSTGPTAVLDGSAVTFGARAMGSFRSGLAANMVDVGLVSEEVGAKAGYSEFAKAEEAIFAAENSSLAGSSAASAAKPNPFGSAKTNWWSRAPTDGKGYSGMGQYSQRRGSDGVYRDSGYPHGGADGNDGARRDAYWPGQGPSRTNGARHPGANGASRSVTHRPKGRQMVYAERGTSAIDGFCRTIRGDGQERSSATGRDAGTAWSRNGGSDPAVSGRSFDDMDVEEDMRDDCRGAERGRGGSNNGPNYRTVPSASAGGARPVGRVGRDKDLDKSKETRKENRRWNLKHMRATQDEGKMDVCMYCRLHPDGGLMVCANTELAKFHSFCFPCLAKKEGIEKNTLTAGSMKWNCPICRERKERPQRRSQPPSSLRGAAWEGGGVLTSPCAVPHGAGHQTPGANGRFREPDRVFPAGEGRGIKRTLSSTEVSAALREREGRSSPTFFLPAVHPSSSSGGGGGEAYAFRRDTSSRGSDGSGGGGSEGVAAAAAGGGWSEEGSSSPANLTLERKRLLRLVATLALDRLQELDPLDLFKDPVPSGVAGYAEAIEFPIDFSTIRRRSQWGLYASIMDLALDVELLCANARAFNAPGTVYHTAAISVQEGAKRLWPKATSLLDSLSSAETTAARHRLRGPAASSDAWPLDGPFAGFEVTPANESAYYMHIAIRRAAAAYRAREEEETKQEKEGVYSGPAGHGDGRGVEGGRGWGGGGDKAKEARVKVAVDVAVFAASSAAFLYTHGQMCDEESLLRDSLSAFKADCVERWQRREADCAKCEPIDRAALLTREKRARPLPTPVARQKAAPDGEFLTLDPASDRPVPMDPNPKLEEDSSESATVAVAPEWRVLQAAHGAKQRSGEESARHMRTFRKFFKEVDARSKTRLRVEKSPVQGLGVFATQAIRAHELVAEYVGERLKLNEAQKRTAKYRETNVTDYVVRLDERTFIDGTKKGNISRFFNHSCDPNCYAKTVAAGKEHALDKRVCFFSLREIRPGEEISYAYPAPHKIGLGAVVAVDCTCRAPGCRGRMSTREQL